MPPTRNATIADVTQMAHIHQTSFEKGWGADVLRGMMDKGGALVAEHRGNVVGFLLFQQVLDESEIITFAVTKEQRGAGFGRGLVEAYLSRMKEAGICRIFLEVAEDNVSARGLYERAGFTESGRRKGYYQRWHGRRVDAVTMECRIL